MKLLEGKVALVTGVTRGIGRAIITRLAEHGARVAGVWAASATEAAALERELEGRGVDHRLFQGDVADPDFATRATRSAVDAFGRLDLLVNNAGITRDGFAMQMTDEEWTRVFATNFGGTYNFCLAAIPHFEAQGGGRVVNMVSVSGVLGREAQINYGTTKGAITGLTRLLSRRYASRGIQFNLVAPGMIETEMLGHVPRDKIENFVRHTSMRRLGAPDEVADAVVFLGSELSRYVSSFTLRLDGGFMR